MEEERREAPNQERGKQIETVLKFIIKLALVSLAFWALFTFVFGVRRVSGETMYPRLRDGDLILYYRMADDYQIGDVVTFERRYYPRVARIVAQGGDVVDLNEDGQLVVNGNVQDEEIFYPTEPDNDGGVSFPYTVEADSYFVLCDNRIASVDSRSFGAIPKSDLDGKIIMFLCCQEI